MRYGKGKGYRRTSSLVPGGKGVRLKENQVAQAVGKELLSQHQMQRQGGSTIRSKRILAVPGAVTMVSIVMVSVTEEHVIV